MRKIEREIGRFMFTAWLLILVLVAEGNVTIKTVKVYKNQGECEAEREDLFKKNFKQAYPTENNWGFKCVPGEEALPTSKETY